MFESFSSQQLVFFAILIVAFGLLITERLRNDVVAVLIILSLAVSGILTPDEALSGFGSEPAIVVAAIFVLSAGIYQTGLADLIGQWIGRLAGQGLTRSLAVIMPSVALLSAFTHHLTTTAVMLPVTLNHAREHDIPPSKLLMPLSFAASLGTTITIIGAPAFLIASGILQQFGRPGLGIFSIAPIGIALSVAGTAFMLLVGRFLLPTRKGRDDTASHFRLDDYFTELRILPDSQFLDKTVEDVEQDNRYHIKVVGLIRRGRHLHRPLAKRRLRPGDVLLVRTSPDELVAFRQEHGVELNPVEEYESNAPPNGHEDEDISDHFAQAVVAADSELVGHTLGEIDFRRRYGAIVLSLWRQNGWLHEELSRIRLRPGDVLVLQGDDETLARLANERDFTMMAPFQGEHRPRSKAPVAGAIMIATVAAAALNVLSIEMAMVAGALAMVLSGSLTPRQAYRAIDARIFVFIAGAIPLGTAMQKVGASDLLANWLQNTLGGLSQWLILLALFAVVGVLTQFMSDAATTALFGPVAAALALALGQPPEPFVITVAMAAVTSFLTPIGHHGNLLVYGPGGYQFADFARVGTPLTIVVALVVALLAPVVFSG